MTKQYYVYLITNKKRGVLYVGITSDLPRRIWEHKNKVVKGFSEKYNLDKLVYYEALGDPENAIVREKRVKDWKRDWKIQMIESNNPEWRDLYEEICS